MPILLQQKPLPDLQAKEIRAWLDHPAAQLFRNYIAAKANEATVHVGNLTISREIDENEDASEHIQVARKLEDFIELIDMVRGSEYKFEVAEIVNKQVTPS